MQVYLTVFVKFYKKSEKYTLIKSHKFYNLSNFAIFSPFGSNWQSSLVMALHFYQSAD